MTPLALVRAFGLACLVLATSVHSEAAFAERGARESDLEIPHAEVVTATLVVKVAQRDPAAVAIIHQTETLGGYFSSLAQDRVVLRVPAAKADELLAFAPSLGLVVDRSFARTDRSFELSDLQSRLAAREAMLQQYMVVLSEASADAVLTVERQIVNLVSEMEGFKGRIRVLEHDIAMAEVTVSFEFRDRQAPSRDGSSSFAWLNTLNLEDLVVGFRSALRHGHLSSVLVPPPKDFAPYRQRSEYRAASPDGVVFRVRKERQKPEADLSFWKEAARKRMADAGYHVTAVQDLDAAGTPGFLLETAAPMGTEDYAYLVAFFPRGRKLVVAEAAGEVSRFEARKAAVLDAIRAMKL
jgi:hypothetical protein